MKPNTPEPPFQRRWDIEHSDPYSIGRNDWLSDGSQTPELSHVENPTFKGKLKKKVATLALAATVVTGGIIGFTQRGDSDSSSRDATVGVEAEIDDHTTLEREGGVGDIVDTKSLDETDVDEDLLGVFELTGNPADDEIITWFESASKASKVTVYDVPFLPVVDSQDSLNSDIFSALESTGLEIISSGDNTESEQTQTLREQTMEKLEPQFLLAFKHPSGININVHASRLNGGVDLKVDADSLSTTITHAIVNSRKSNNGYLTNEELTIIESSLEAQSFDGKVLDIVFLGEQRTEADFCAEDFSISLKQLGKTEAGCEVAGFMTYEQTDRYSVSSPAELMVVQLGSRVSIVGNPDSIDESSVEFVEQIYDEISVVKTIEHEIGHYLAGLSGSKNRRFLELDAVARMQASEDGALNYDLYDSIRAQLIVEMIDDEHHNYVDAIGDYAWSAHTIKEREISINLGNGETYVIKVPVPLFNQVPIEINRRS
jgi:hypothetical protein